MLRILLILVLMFSMGLGLATQRRVIQAERELRNASAGAGRPYYSDQDGILTAMCGIDDHPPFAARTDGEGSAICFERDDLYGGHEAFPLGSVASDPTMTVPEVPRGGKVI